LYPLGKSIEPLDQTVKIQYFAIRSEYFCCELTVICLGFKQYCGAGAATSRIIFVVRTDNGAEIMLTFLNFSQ
jgi:hypothetical protein